MDYRISHIEPKKGILYDKSFSDFPYRRYVWDWEQQVLESILSKYFATKPENYLDFACGTGRILSFLENRVIISLGIDVSESMLVEAKKNVKKSNLLIGDITRDDLLQSCKFDLITAFRFFLNAQWSLKYEVIQKLSACLKKDGYLVFNIHMNKACLLGLMYRIYSKLKRKPLTFNLMSDKEVLILIESAGLKLINQYHYGVIPVYDVEGTKWPFRLYNAERLFSKLPLFKNISQNSIYICQKREIYDT
jgi:SAM-dependent methyltransferase